MNKILKKNEYKCVELHEKPDGSRYISKRYSGHAVEHLASNTEYVFTALQFFHEQFSEILDCPQPYAIDLNNFQVRMEYLSNLPSASRLTFKTLSLADTFFHTCYSIRDDLGFLRSVRNSVVATPKINELLDRGFPLSLGLKGDLRENLCLGNSRLILADIDSIAIEPLGLSELLLYVELYASLMQLPALPVRLISPPVPVAFQYLNKSNAQQLIIAAREMLGLKMQDIAYPLRAMKHVVSQTCLNVTVDKFYR